MSANEDNRSRFSKIKCKEQQTQNVVSSYEDAGSQEVKYISVFFVLNETLLKRGSGVHTLLPHTEYTYNQFIFRAILYLL